MFKSSLIFRITATALAATLASQVVFAQYIERIPQPSKDKKIRKIMDDAPASWKGFAKNLTLHISGESGFLKKIDLIRRAKPGTTIDMAYFIFESDYTSSFLARELMRAAKKGVQVRILVDYVMSENFKNWLGTLDANKNIEVKRYNPATPEFLKFLESDLEMADPNAFVSALARQNSQELMGSITTSPVLMEKMTTIAPVIAGLKALPPEKTTGPQVVQTLLTTLSLEDAAKAFALQKHIVEFTKRLHHKLLAVETTAGIEFINGGRNLSDEYHLSPGHELLKDRNYPFFDAETSGLIVSKEGIEFKKEFEDLWFSKQTSQALDSSIQDEKIVLKEIAKKSRIIENSMSRIEKATKEIIVQKGYTQVNYAENRPVELDHNKDITDYWAHIIRNAKDKVTIVSAYLYLKDLPNTKNDLADAIKEAAANGVKVDLHTNSFESTDMNIVNIVSYKNFEEWQKSLGEGAKNVRLLELNKGPKQGSLHAKIINVDDQVIGVGSANSDPRSDLYDSNNFLIVNLENRSAVAKKFFESYTQELPWKQVTQEYVNQYLKVIGEKNPEILKISDVPGFDNQL